MRGLIGRDELLSVRHELVAVLKITDRGTTLYQQGGIEFEH